LKLLVEVDGEAYVLDLKPGNGVVHYTLRGAATASGSASVEEVMPGVFSIIMGSRSFTVNLAQNDEGLEVWVGNQRHSITVSDARDRSGNSQKRAAGPVEMRAHMPGKVVKILVELGENVDAGQGLIVVEAMKMQNEMRAPKAGRVVKIYAREGTTVAAGAALMMVE